MDMDLEQRPRPIRVTLLALLIICFALFEGLRLGSSIYFWKTLIEYGAPPFYLAISGAFWFISGCVLVWGLWTGRHWAWLGSLLGAVAFLIWYWLDRLLLQQPHSNGLFAAIASGVIFILVLLILLTTRTRRFFLGRGA